MLLIQIGKKISLRIWSQSLLKITNDVNRHLKLLFLQDKPFFFFVDDLNSLFHLIIEVKDKCFKSELNICDFFEAKINKIFIISPTYLFIVSMHLRVEQRCKIPLKILALWFSHPYLDVAEDDKVINPRILVSLKLLLK
jgi:hypothetical protein